MESLGVSRSARALRLLAIAFLASLALAARAGAAGPYEPNDSLLSAAGPLAPAQTYAAAIETPGDRDFFYFYVTSSPSAEVRLALRNLGGSVGISDVDATILNLLGTPLAAVPYVERGEERAATVTLEPQKYIVEIASAEGSTDAYSLTTGGTAGAFGPYARIGGRCSTATRAAAVAEARLSRAKTRLQRATSRLRRAHYGSAASRAAARALRRKAQARVRTEKKALSAAETGQQPWCSIPQ